MKPRHLGLRVDDLLHEKLRYIAEREGRRSTGKFHICYTGAFLNLRKCMEKLRKRNYRMLLRVAPMGEKCLKGVGMERQGRGRAPVGVGRLEGRLPDLCREVGDAARARSMQGGWRCCARPVYAERMGMLRLP